MGLRVIKPVGWEDRLVDYIESNRNRPFKWGVNDCVLFALTAIERVYCVDILSELPEWDDQESAYEVINELAEELDEGPKNLLGVSREWLPYLGFVKIDRNYVARGDLVVTQGPNGPMFSVSLGRCLAAPGIERLQFLPISGECWEYRGNL